MSPTIVYIDGHQTSVPDGVSKQVEREGTVVRLNALTLGGHHVTAVKSEGSVLENAWEESGPTNRRGGWYNITWHWIPSRGKEKS